MSQDIRLFFSRQKQQKQKIEEDDDVIPESPDVQLKSKKKESRKKRVIDDDSDEEIFSSKKKKSKASISNKSKVKTKNDYPPKTNLTSVKAIDIFGSAPIKRTEPLLKTKKKTETCIHSDDEFEKSLLQIDEIEKLAENEIKKEKDNNHDSITVKKETEVEKIECHLKTDSVNHVDSKNDILVRKIENGECFSSCDNNKTGNNINEEVNKSKLKSSDKKKHTNNVNCNKREGNKSTSKEEKKIEFTETIIKNKDSKIKNETVIINDDSEINSDLNVSKKDKRKREFAEFIDDDIDMTVIEDDDKARSKNKKQKLNNTHNESVLTDEERYERKRHSAVLYQQYLNRSGPKHLGAKEIPEGSPNCLVNCAFLLTGVLDSFERDEVAAAITKFGGSVKNSISKKVTHVLAGEEAGPAKIAKAQELGIKIINEDQFLQLILDLSKKPNKDVKKLKVNKDVKKDVSPSRVKEKHKSDTKNETNVTSNESKKSSSKNESQERHNKAEIKQEMTPNGKTEHKNASKYVLNDEQPNITQTETKTEEKINEPIKSETNGVKSEDFKAHSPSALLWVEKHKPQTVKHIIGQHGGASNVKKLTNWLTKWYVNRKAKLSKPNPWAKNDDGAYYKAALLSGPPGVGKSTTVALVCKELGFDVVEFNASDTRNKTLIKEQISELLTTTSLSGYAKGVTGKQAVTKKHVLVMDEVDGMAGNEDRGGLQELIGLIKSTAVPILCICNDRNSQKMRTLVNYCYDLRFNKPRVDQIKSAMMTICFKENVKIPPDALTQLIVAANQDVRQTLNLLSMWAVEPSIIESERLKKDAQSGKKDIKLGPWEAVRKVFSADEHKTMSINDKSDLFFYDYSLAPLFVQENYLHVAPHCPKHEVLDRLSKAADNISTGDLVDRRIRGAQAWSLLPMQAMYSSVIPGHHMAGHITAQIQFPGWLGKNSRATKMHRLCQEIHAHTRLSTSGSKSSIFLDYAKHLRDAIVSPLVKDKADGIDKSLQVLESYHLLREDLDSLTELSMWPGQRDPMILVDSKVKAAMTRTYNKKASALPYAPSSIRRGRGHHEDSETYTDADVNDEADADSEDSDPENDALIKKKKSKDTEKPSSSKEKAGSSKENSSSSKQKSSSSKEKGKKK